MGVVDFRVGEHKWWRIFRSQRPDMTTRGDGDQLSVGYARSGELDNSNYYIVGFDFQTASERKLSHLLVAT